MKLVSVSLPLDIYNNIKIITQSKAISVSSCIRQLAELGLKIEQMAQQKSTVDTEADDLKLLQKVTQHSALLNQEMLYLIRFLVRRTNTPETENHNRLLQDCATKAQTVVTALVT